MDKHGGSFPLILRKINRKAIAQDAQPDAGLETAANADKPPTVAGFRHFLGDPTEQQRFKIYGNLEPWASEENLCKLRLLMGRLAKRMSDEFWWPAHGKAGLEAWENPGIPAGYTYLLQLVAHDLVQTSVPISIIEDTATGVLNTRRSGLRLDAIYGGGPLVCPFAYALDDKSDETRTMLRLGRMQSDPQNAGMGAPFRDIARVGAARASGEVRDVKTSSGVREALTDVLIADPRNDANVILSQMTALFHHLHNGILEMLPKRDVMSHAASKWEAAHERFLCARGAVTLIYRNIIRKDLMEKVLHPRVYEAYRQTGFKPLALAGPEQSEAPAAIVPLEFAHGAFRFGHAMIRPRYQINQYRKDPFPLGAVIGRTSAKEPLNMPLDKPWVVQWSHFFEINGSKPNLSRRIGPQLSGPLTTPDIFPAIVQTSNGTVCPRENEIEANSAGLAYRDLMSGGLLGMWSVDALIRQIAVEMPNPIRTLIAQSKLLSDPLHRAKLLREWASGTGQYHQFNSLTDSADIGSISQDPPLPFFVLFEAAMEPEQKGMTLGVLGSVMVAEVVFGALAQDQLPAEIGATSLKEALSNLSASIYDGTDHFGGVEEIETMSRLVEFTAEQARLKNAVPAFL